MNALNSSKLCRENLLFITSNLAINRHDTSHCSGHFFCSCRVELVDVTMHPKFIHENNVTTSIFKKKERPTGETVFKNFNVCNKEFIIVNVYIIKVF